MAIIKLDIEIKNYLNEVKDKDLIMELEKRKYTIVRINTPIELKQSLLEIFGLKPFHSKERVIKEIEDLFL